MNSYTPAPSPGSMPTRRYEGTANAGHDAEQLDTEQATAAVREQVAELLEQVDTIGESSGESFDLVALARQAQLLEQAHDALTTALDAVDRG